MEIKELVGLARNKDNVAIAEIIQLTEKKAFYIALNVVKNDETARDIVQESYIKAFQKLDLLDDDAKFVSWFNQIVSRQALDYHKSSYNQHRPTEFSAMDDEENRLEFEANIANDRKEFEPDASFDYGELKEGVQGVLDDLPENQRAALVMYYFEDMKVSEISQVFNVSDNTVKGYLAYGRKKIKNTIEGMRLKGVSFYGVAPMPFLTWMLKDQFAKTAVTHVSKDIIIKTVTTSTVTAGVASTTSKHGIKKAFASASTKVKAGVCAGAVATTGAVGYAIHDYNSNYNQVVRAMEKLDTLQQFTVVDTLNEEDMDPQIHHNIIINTDNSDVYYGMYYGTFWEYSDGDEAYLPYQRARKYKVEEDTILYTAFSDIDTSTIKLDEYENECKPRYIEVEGESEKMIDFPELGYTKAQYRALVLGHLDKAYAAYYDYYNKEKGTNHNFDFWKKAQKKLINNAKVEQKDGNTTYTYTRAVFKSNSSDVDDFWTGVNYDTNLTRIVTINSDGYVIEINDVQNDTGNTYWKWEFTDFVK